MLSCTELELLTKGLPNPLRSLDSTRIHADAAWEIAIGAASLYSMNTAMLLADPLAIRLKYVRNSAESITLVVRAVLLPGSCPCCCRGSAKVHSQYTRHVADLPRQGVSVKLELHARRFRCGNDQCPQRIFCERLPHVVGPYGRRTVRLKEALSLIGFLISGEAGARLAHELGIAVSPDTLLRRARQSAAMYTKTEVPVCVLGMDDFACRRGCRYGTLFVDLERRHPIDLLPDREAETLSLWLKAHPGVRIITRDRSKTYASGITEGAPTARQVADRWHLLKNLREALEKLLKRQLSGSGKV